jgi:hypothetical protein
MVSRRVFSYFLKIRSYIYTCAQFYIEKYKYAMLLEKILSNIEYRSSINELIAVIAFKYICIYMCVCVYIILRNKINKRSEV